MLGILPALFLLTAPLAAQGGYLGVALEPQVAADDAAAGARIQSVEERSAATFLGLQAGDLVTAVDGAPVASAQQFAGVIGAMLPGSIVDLTVERGDKVLVLSGVLGRRPGLAAPQVPPAPSLGMAPQWGGMRRVEMPQLEMMFDHGQLELQLQGIEQMMEQMRVQMPQIEMMFEPGRMQLPQLQMPSLDGGQGSVHLRYPASTPEAERQKLIDEAKAKYGEGVEVEFAGEGTMLRIERSIGNVVPLPQGAVPQAPAPAPRSSESGVEEF